MTNFLTAEQLNISQRQYDALIGAKELFESGKVKYTDDFGSKGKNFNMDYWFQKTDQECGTIGCIGGWAEWVDARKKGIKLEWHGLFPMSLFNKMSPTHNPGLDALFYGGTTGYYQDTTPQHAIKAINNYLTNGYPDWEEVMKEEPALV